MWMVDFVEHGRVFTATLTEIRMGAVGKAPQGAVAEVPENPAAGVSVYCSLSVEPPE